MTASLYCPTCVLTGATVPTVEEARHLADVHDSLHQHPRETMTVTVRGRLGRRRIVRGEATRLPGVAPGTGI